MTNNSNKGNILRYSDSDLLEFKTLIESKLANSYEQIKQIQEQSLELSESLQASGYDADENHAFANVEFLNGMVLRQQKHIRDLENALIRVKNKSYGICIVNGQLIDKRRLLAVPTTTKSLEAKNEAQRQLDAASRPKMERKPLKMSAEPKLISKIIKKTSTNPAPKPILDDDEDDDLNDNFDFEEGNIDMVDVENLIDGEDEME